jgi:hypothetical protein
MLIMNSGSVVGKTSSSSSQFDTTKKKLGRRVGSVVRM